MNKFIVKAVSTFFYIGYLPLIPGTFGSMAAVAVFFLVKHNLLIYTCAFIALGFLTSGRAEAVFGRKDASCIIIDEVAGMLLALLFLPYYSMETIVIAFCLFRILDAIKPYPANKLQSLKGSLGIMSDDIVAGLYANIILQVVLRLVSFRVS